MTHEEQLGNKLYRNWVRAALGLKYLKEGAANVVETEVKRLHRSFLKDIGTTLALRKVACGQCTTENVVPCPTKGICGVRGRCAFHGLNDPSKLYRQCPNKVCDQIFNKIVVQHRNDSPSWKNTDASKWCAEPWEIAKCYMAESGYKDKATAAETDCAGILSVVINGLFMQNALTAQINPPTDIFSKNRLVRNAIMHSATLEVTDDQLREYIDNMITLLKDEKQLEENQEAKNAIQRLKQLKNDNVVITTRHELEVRNEAFKAIDERGKDAMQAIDAKLAEALQIAETKFTEKRLEAQHMLHTKHQETVKDISERQGELMTTADEKETEVGDTLAAIGDKQKTYMLSTRDELAADLKTRAEDAEAKLESKLDIALQETLAVLEQAKRECNQQQTILIDQFTSIQQDLQKYKDTVVSLQADQQTVMERHQIIQTERYNDRVGWIQRYHQRKEQLQKSLREMYKRHLSTIPVSPLLKETHASIATFYTDLVVRDDLVHELGRRNQSNRSVVESYRHVFYKPSHVFYKKDKACKRIFVLGNAGFGKTTWSMKLVNTWLTNLEKKEASEEMNMDEQVLSKFEFVFFVQLRHAKKDGQILDMIRNQLYQSNPGLMEITREVMEHDSFSCLIVLDGLDEWSMPADQARQIDDSGLPGRNDSYKCTILTTTRSWKLESLCLKPQEIDRAVEIKGLDDKGIAKLADQIVQNLNKKTSLTKGSQDFMKFAKDLVKLVSVPLILCALVCLWYENDSIRVDGTLANVYSELIDYLIKYTDEGGKLSDVSNILEVKKALSCSNCYLPECLSSKRFCKAYSRLLLNIGKLAFHGLFSLDTESCLVFTQESIEKHLSNEELEIALKIGILSQSKIIGNVFSRKFSISFLHKMFQEFLASVFMISGDEKQKLDCLVSYKTYCKSYKDVFEMENILLFVSGMCPTVAGEMTEHISCILSRLHSDCIQLNKPLFNSVREENEDRLMSSDFHLIFTKQHADCIRLNKLLFDCVKEECLISRDSHHVYIKQHFLGLRENAFGGLFPETADTVRYIANNSQKHIALHVSWFPPDDEVLDTLCQCMQGQNQVIELTISIDHTVRSDTFSRVAFSRFKQKLESIQCITNAKLVGIRMEENDMSGEEVLNLAPNTTLRKFEYNNSNVPVSILGTHLEELKIKRVSPKSVQTIVKALEHAFNLTKIGIAQRKVRVHTPLDIVFSKAANPTCIRIQGLNISSMLVNVVCLREVILCNKNLQGSVHQFIESMKRAPEITTLICGGVGHVGNVDLSQNTKLKKLIMVNVISDRITLPRQGCLQTLDIRYIRPPVGNASHVVFDFQLQKELQRLEIKTFVGNVGHLDFTYCNNLTVLKLSHVVVENILIPSQGCLKELQLHYVRFTDCGASQNVFDIHCCQSLDTLVLGNISRHVNVVLNEGLKRLNLIHITVDRISVPVQCCLQTVLLDNTRLPDPLGQRVVDLEFVKNNTRCRSNGNTAVNMLLEELSAINLLNNLTIRNTDFKSNSFTISGRIYIRKIEFEECKMLPENWKTFINDLRMRHVDVCIKSRKDICKLDNETLESIRTTRNTSNSLSVKVKTKNVYNTTNEQNVEILIINATHETAGRRKAVKRLFRFP